MLKNMIARSFEILEYKKDNINFRIKVQNSKLVLGSIKFV